MNELQIKKLIKHIEDFCCQENLVVIKHSTFSTTPLSIEIGKEGYFINGNFMLNGSHISICPKCGK